MITNISDICYALISIDKANLKTCLLELIAFGLIFIVGLIVEEEQQGKTKAKYGKYLIKNLSQMLTTDFGKGFGIANLKNFRQFYLTFPIGYAVRGQLENEKSYASNSHAFTGW